MMAPTQQSIAAERHVLALVTGGTICMQDSPGQCVPTQITCEPHLT